MARAIDADRLLRVLESNFGHTGGAAVMRQLVEMQPTLTTPSEWVSMGDRKPKFPNQTCNEMMVIVCTKNGYVMPMVRTRGQVGEEMVEGWLFPWDKIYVGPEITYWMSLPEPPKEELKNADD